MADTYPVIAIENDTLDRICFRETGKTTGVLEQVMELNPQYAGKIILSRGDIVLMPKKPTTKQELKITSIWD